MLNWKLRNLSWKNLMILTAMFLSSCGGTTGLDDYYITFRMVGVFTQPETATGNNEPIAQTFKLTAISLFDADGNEYQLLTDGTTEYKVINRAQVVYQKLISESYYNVAFNQAKLVFAPVIAVDTKVSTDVVVTLDSSEASYNEPFTIEKARDYTFTVKSNWKNTVTRDETTDPVTESISSPTFTLVLGD